MSRVIIQKQDDEDFILSVNGNDLIVTISEKVHDAVTVRFFNAETGEPTTMEILTKVQQVALSVAFLDAEGDPAPVDGDPVWSVANSTIGHLDVDPSDAMKATFVADMVGTTQVNVQADADLGDGVKTITGLLDIQVLAAEAVTVAISAGTPTDAVPPTKTKAKGK